MGTLPDPLLPALAAHVSNLSGALQARASRTGSPAGLDTVTTGQ